MIIDPWLNCWLPLLRKRGTQCVRFRLSRKPV